MGLKWVAASIGAGFGVLAIVTVRLFNVVSPMLRGLLLPGGLLTAGYQGEHPWTAGVLVGIIQLAGNVVIYGLAGLGIGWGIERFSKQQ